MTYVAIIQIMISEDHSTHNQNITADLFLRADKMMADLVKINNINRGVDLLVLVEKIQMAAMNSVLHLGSIMLNSEKESRDVLEKNKTVADMREKETC